METVQIRIYRGSYMSAHVLLSLSNELGKRDKMRGIDFNKFNNTGARMLDSFYHMTLTLFWTHIFRVRTLGLCHIHIICDVKSVIS